MATRRSFATSAYTHADEGELIFLGPPEEETKEYAPCVWQGVEVIYGMQKVARSWQDHFHHLLLSDETKEAGFTVRAKEMCPTMFYLEEADGVLELHVDMDTGSGSRKSSELFWST